MQKVPKYKQITALRALELLILTYDSSYSAEHRLCRVRRELEEHIKFSIARGSRRSRTPKRRIG